MDQSSHSETDSSSLESMRTSHVDRIASLLVSACALLGIAVTLLTITYFDSLNSWDPPIPVSTPVAEQGGASSASEVPFVFEMLDPVEVAELEEPDFKETLDSLSQLVSSNLEAIDELDRPSSVASSGSVGVELRRTFSRFSDPDVIPRHERWELILSAPSRQSYARQLDALRIELAAIGGGISHIDYVSELSTTPMVRTGRSIDETRLMFHCDTENALLPFAQELLARSGVPVEKRFVIFFIGKDLEETLARMEMQHAMETLKTTKPIRAKHLAKTVFRSVSGADGKFQFEVVAQLYRRMSEFDRGNASKRYNERD